MNLSVLDGWWGEGYNGHNGWGLPPGTRASTTSSATWRGQRPARHHRARDVAHLLPARWRRLFRGLGAAVQGVDEITIPRFNSERMLRDYVTRLYWPARQQRRKLEANNAEIARSLAAWKHRVRSAWPGST